MLWMCQCLLTYSPLCWAVSWCKHWKGLSLRHEVLCRACRKWAATTVPPTSALEPCFQNIPIFWLYFISSFCVQTTTISLTLHQAISCGTICYENRGGEKISICLIFCRNDFGKSSGQAGVNTNFGSDWGSQRLTTKATKSIGFHLIRPNRAWKIDGEENLSQLLKCSLKAWSCSPLVSINTPRSNTK